VGAAWLADNVLLIACAPRAEGHDRVRTSRPAVAGSAVMAGDHPAGAADAVVASAIEPGALDTTGSLAVHAGDVAVDAGVADVRDVLADLREFLREYVALWSAADRASLIALLVSLAAELPATRSLADGLHAVREALRERRALSVVAEGAERAVQVDRLHRIDDHAFYVAGWLWEPSSPVTTLRAVSPEGERVDLLNHAFRHARYDVAERFGAPAGAAGGAGFVCHFTTTAPSALADGWVLETANATGRGVETFARLASTDPAAVRAAIVADASTDLAAADALVADHVSPALTRLQELRRRSTEIATHDLHGRLDTRAEVSVIVPLFERTDLLEHQMAQWVDDPAMAECELIYVLDSPDQRDHVRAFAAGLFRLYDVPFQVVALTGNAGVAGARNLGASVATGRRLLFLDSDVLPATRGWLAELTAALDAAPSAGALSPKLIYEDDAVQHAGISFERAAGAPEWTALHRFKGLHRSTPAANAGGAVPAVTGACMMIEATLFDDVGGMSWDYVQGDYEDVDFCMRLAEAGRHVRYVPAIELYHLEGLSYVSDERAANRRYNRWLFSRLWGERLEKLG